MSFRRTVDDRNQPITALDNRIFEFNFLAKREENNFKRYCLEFGRRVDLQFYKTLTIN